jgi:hypothetical protein
MSRQVKGFFTDKITLIICAFTIFCITSDGFCQENIPSPTAAAASTEAVETTEKTEPTMWQKIWGEKSRDALLLGMWSVHLKGTGEYFGGSGESNEQNKLFGIIYNGIGAGTFINSHDDRSYIIAVGRDVYSRELAENTRFDIGYRLGPLYGYGDSLPNIDKVSVFAAGTFSISWYNFGVDIMVIPIGVITGGFRIDF